MSPFTNTILLLPVVITDLAKSAASPWGKRYASPDCIKCGDFETVVAGTTNSTTNACNAESDNKCSWDALKALCVALEDTCVPSSANRCCVKEPASLTVSFFGMQANYSSVFAYCVTISVVLQILLLFMCGPLADFERYHKRLFVTSTVVCYVCVILVLFSPELAWEYAAVLFVIANVAFGVADVMYNAYIPKLFPPDSYDAVGAKGYVCGQFGGQICLLLSFAPLLGIERCLWGVSVALGLSGVWMAIFSSPFMYLVPSTAEKPIPEGHMALTTGLRETISVWRLALKFPELFKFLLAYFVFSDGYSTIVETAAVFASETLCFDFVGLVILIMIVEFTSALGAFGFMALIEYVNLRIRTAMLANLAAISLLPFLVLPGLNVFSSEYTWTFYLVAAFFGINLGSISALGRTFYARLLPLGSEGQFFAFFEITAKGTSWLGPLIVSIIKDATGEFSYGFFSLIFFFIVGALLLLRVDERKGARDVGRAGSDNKLIARCPVQPESLGSASVKEAEDSAAT